MVFAVGSNPVVIALPHQIVVFMIHGSLGRNHLPLLPGNFCHVQLVSKGAGQRHMPSGLKGNRPVQQMVRAVRHMGAHGG